jgi:hypothetical protein
MRTYDNKKLRQNSVKADKNGKMSSFILPFFSLILSFLNYIYVTGIVGVPILAGRRVRSGVSSNKIIKLRCGVAQIGCGVAQTGCGVLREGAA